LTVQALQDRLSAPDKRPQLSPIRSGA